MPIVALLAAWFGTAVPARAQDAVRWTLTDPELVVGGVASDGEGALAELGGATLLEDGRLLVGDRVEPYLKVFDTDGSFIRTLGRRGSGPGEYEYVYEFDRCAPGEIAVFDVDQRVHRYTEALEALATEVVRIDAIGGTLGYERDCHPNGLQVVTGWGDFMAQFEEGYFESRAPVLLVQGQDVVHDFGERLSSERVGSVRPDGSPSGSGPHPFGRATVVALGTGFVYVGDAAGYSIEVYDLEGSPVRPLTWSGPPLDYDDELVAALAERAVAAAGASNRPGLRRRYAALPELEQLPAYDRILVSDSDEVWVRQFVRPGAMGEEWVVFGEDQGLIGRLVLPLGSTLWEVRGDRVVYSVLDELDVPVVYVRRIVRPS